MNLIENAQMLQGQGPIFWGAAAAVALGATLLVTAGWVQIRRLRRSRTSTPGGRKVVTVTENGYAATPPVAGMATAEAPPAAAAAPTPPLPDERLIALGARLSGAADRLEAMRASLKDQGRPGSGLKETPNSVEYVFRSGTA